VSLELCIKEVLVKVRRYANPAMIFGSRLCFANPVLFRGGNFVIPVMLQRQNDRWPSRQDTHVRRALTAYHDVFVIFAGMAFVYVMPASSLFLSRSRHTEDKVKPNGK
jgi:hypothetical protein